MRRVVRYAHPDAAGADCMHIDRGSAIACRDGDVGRAATVEMDDITIPMGVITVPTFADTMNDVLVGTLMAALRSFFEVTVSAGVNGDIGHQNVDEFTNYLHDWVDDRAMNADRQEAARVEISDVLGRLAPEPTEPSADDANADAVNAETANAEIQRLETTNHEILQRAEAAEAELTTVRADMEAANTSLSDAAEEVQRLRKVPLNPPPRPVQYPAVAAPREFAANNANQSTEADPIQTLVQRREALMTAAAAEHDGIKRQAVVQQIVGVEASLTRLGWQAT